MSPDIFDKQITELRKINPHVCPFWISIVFRRRKLEKKRDLFLGAKMAIKRPIIPIIDQGSIFRLYPKFTPNFLRRSEMM